MSSSTPFGPEQLVKEIGPWLLNALDEGTRQAYRWIWDGGMEFLKANWLWVGIVLFVIFLIALANALSGRWGMLGSVMYNYLYFGILFIAGLIKGPEIFVSEYFELFCAALLYPLCYIAVGQILEKTGLKTRY